jgi:hypothetical protein
MRAFRTDEDPTQGSALWRWAMNSLIVSVWIAVCAATPEFIWRGARIVVRHFSWSDLAAALFVGLILAFCIEPAMERLRHRLSKGAGADAHHPPAGSPLFAAAMGLAFALASVCLHDAITAFLSVGQDDHAHQHLGLATGITIAAAWTMVPFFTSLAWLSVDRHRLRIPLGLLAALSPLIAGQLFSWSLADTVTTVLPCLTILMLGYREIAARQGANGLARCVRGIAWFVPVWLLAALVVNYCLGLLGLARFEFYSVPEIWIDARFYCGWAIGLLLVPPPTAPRRNRA